MGNKDGAITVVTLGDLHCGSNLAVAYPALKLCSGNSLELNRPQAALFDRWRDMAREWHRPDMLIVNGDAIEGQARKESGVPCWSTDLDNQIECAARLIEMFGAKKIYIIDGTGYHVDAGGKSLENHLAKRVGAVSIGDGDGQISADELFVSVGGFTFHAAHHIQVGTGWYRTTPMARELMFALLNESHKYKVDVVLRSHAHYFCGVEFTRQRGYNLPCWQLQTRYMKKKSALGMVPDIGGLRFRVYPGEIRVDKRFVKVPESKPKLFKYEL